MNKITKSKIPAQQVRIGATLKMYTPRLAQQFADIDRGVNRLTIDKPVAVRLRAELAKISAKTLQMFDKSMSVAIGKIRSACEECIATLSTDKIEQELVPLGVFLLKELKRPGRKVKVSVKPAKPRAAAKKRPTIH